MQQVRQEIKLGYAVVDVITGFTGIVYAAVDLLNGAHQYSVLQAVDPRAKEYPEGMSLDENMLDIVEDKLSARVIPVPESTQRIELGTPVTDNITGFAGIAVRRVTYMNGCVYYDVEAPNPSPERKSPDIRLFVSAERLTVALSPPTSDKSVPQTRTGGPVTRVDRIR